MTEEEFLKNLDAKLDHAITTMEVRRDNWDEAVQTFHDFQAIIRWRRSQVS